MQLSSRSERKAINPKVKLEVGNIIKKIWELLASKVRLFLAESFHHVMPAVDAMKFIRNVCC